MVTKANTMQWTGASGQRYEYYLFQIGTKLKDEPGNYIFTKRSSEGKHSPIYIGQTESLDLRMDGHHKQGCIDRHGATHICAHVQTDEKARLAEEADLIKNWGPPCNG